LQIHPLDDSDTVTTKITELFEASGGFGTFLIVTGKDWPSRENRTRSMRRFMVEVAPQLRLLTPN
jgi:hypothetical protein